MIKLREVSRFAFICFVTDQGSLLSKGGAGNDREPLPRSRLVPGSEAYLGWQELPASCESDSIQRPQFRTKGTLCLGGLLPRLFEAIVLEIPPPGCGAQ